MKPKQGILKNSNRLNRKNNISGIADQPIEKEQFFGATLIKIEFNPVPNNSVKSLRRFCLKIP